MELIKKLADNIKKNRRDILFFLFFSLLNTFFLYQMSVLLSLPRNSTFYIILIISFILELCACLAIKKMKQKAWPTEKIFLILSLIVGTFYVFALPIGRAPDEGSHFFRAYELSNGHLVSDVTETGAIGSDEPSDIMFVQEFTGKHVSYSELASYFNLYPDETNQSFIINTAYNYNIFSYFPQVTGLWIGKILHLPLIATTYLAKLLNLIVCILILYFSIKYIPILKNILFLLTFLPITMQAMASFSPDGLVIATATALISFVLYSIYTLKKPLSKKHFVFMFIVCLFLSMSKIAYAPLCLLLFAIPKERFGTTKKKILSIIGIGSIIFFILILWLILAPSMQSVSDSSAQISTILHRPFKFLFILLNSLSVNMNLYLSGLFGAFLEWFNITLSPLYLIPSFVIFVVLCRDYCQKITVTKSFKYLSILVSFAIILITFTTMFIQWTKTGEGVIDGVQGRYFLPIFLLIPIFFLNVSPKPKLKQSLIKAPQSYYLYAFLIFESVYAISALICNHL